MGTNTGAWLVRAGAKDKALRDFLAHGVVAIKCPNGLPKDRKTLNHETIDAVVASSWSTLDHKQRRVVARYIDRFFREMRIGDAVLVPDRAQRCYFLGQITGQPKFDPIMISDLPAYRPVRWEGKVPRAALSQGTLNSLGAIQALFRIRGDATAELKGKLVPLDAQL